MSYDGHDYLDDYHPFEGKEVPTARLDRVCPRCLDSTLAKPRSEKPQCPACFYIEGEPRPGYELRDFALSARQGRRLLAVFGYTPYGTPGSIGTRLRKLCADHDIERSELNALLSDLRGYGSFRVEGSPTGEEADR